MFKLNDIIINVRRRKEIDDKTKTKIKFEISKMVQVNYFDSFCNMAREMMDMHIKIDKGDDDIEMLAQRPYTLLTKISTLTIGSMA